MHQKKDDNYTCHETTQHISQPEDAHKSFLASCPETTKHTCKQNYRWCKYKMSLFSVFIHRQSLPFKTKETTITTKVA